MRNQCFPVGCEQLESRRLLAINTANELVKIADINGQKLVIAGETLFFMASDAAAGAELWTSDGTSAGTQRVADIRPGTAGSSISSLTAVGNRVYFSADDGVHGAELWTSDGTAAGTRMVADIRPGSEGSTLRHLAAIGDTLYFSADDGVVGWEPWRAIGLNASLLADVRPGAAISQPRDFFEIHGKVLFFAHQGQYASLFLWNPTVQNVEELARFTSYSHQFEHAQVGDRMYFFAPAFTPGVSEKMYLWYTDGTALGTQRITRPVRIHPSSNGLEFAPMAFGSQVIFRGRDAEHGWELWVSDGTESGTQIIKDIAPGTADGLPYGYKNLFGQVSDQVVFSGFVQNEGAQIRRELFRSDGTQSGTQILREGLSPTISTLAGGSRAFFGSSSGILVTDGTEARTVRIDSAISLPQLTAVRDDGIFFFSSNALYRLSINDAVPPQVTSVTDQHFSSGTELNVQLSEVARGSIAPNDFVLINEQTGQRIELDESNVSVDPNFEQRITIRLGSLVDGNYRLSVPVGALSDVWGNVSQLESQKQFFSLLCDLNHDRWVDSRDFSLFASNFNMASSAGDFNRSGVVDIADFAIFAPKFNTYLAPSVAARAIQPSSRELARALAPAPFSSREIDLIQTDEEILSSITDR